ncbi:hypothetical protein SNEBB_006883 [Seison nebaliae]|nr:hypothetical protein SNEBB_006883 [Seison nebaliae]
MYQKRQDHRYECGVLLHSAHDNIDRHCNLLRVPRDLLKKEVSCSVRHYIARRLDANDPCAVCPYNRYVDILSQVNFVRVFFYIYPGLAVANFLILVQLVFILFDFTILLYSGGNATNVRYTTSYFRTADLLIIILPVFTVFSLTMTLLKLYHNQDSDRYWQTFEKDNDFIQYLLADCPSKKYKKRLRKLHEEFEKRHFLNQYVYVGGPEKNSPAFSLVNPLSFNCSSLDRRKHVIRISLRKLRNYIRNYTIFLLITSFVTLGISSYTTYFVAVNYIPEFFYSPINYFVFLKLEPP